MHEGKAEDILILLDMKGNVPEKLRGRIQEETDISQLDEWFVLAAKCETVEEFQDYVC